MPKLLLVQAFREPVVLEEFETVEACQSRADFLAEEIKKQFFLGNADQFWKDTENLNVLKEPTIIAGNDANRVGDKENVLLCGLAYQP